MFSKSLQYDNFFPQSSRSLLWEKTGQDQNVEVDRLLIFIFLKFKSYPKRLIFTVTVSEVRVRVSSKYYHSVFLIWSGLNEPKFRQLVLKTPKSLKWHILEVFWLVLQGSKYRRRVVNELALVFIDFLLVVSTENRFCESFLDCYRYPV